MQKRNLQRRDSYPPHLHAKATAIRQPQRTTKVTQKLVLFPDTVSADGPQTIAEESNRAEREHIPRGFE
jgi:hypothetical protein